MSDLSSAGSPASSPEPQSTKSARNTNGLVDDDSDEDVTTARTSRKHAVNDDEESDVAMGDDLFGDEPEDEGRQSPKRRKLSDSELDSGDDEDRQDRMDVEDDNNEAVQEESLKIIDYDIDRHGIPRGSDGEFYILKFPGSVGIESKMFAPGTFEKPITGHHGAPPGLAYSAAQVANSTIRWRRDPHDPAQLQSNARILRWSDGSLTIQIASMPFDQYELPAKPLAPPQTAPPKPTPISKTLDLKNPPPAYNAKQDTHTYLASIYPQHNLVGITNHITAALNIQVEGEQDAALLKLQEDLALASKAGKGQGGRGPEIVTLTEDPELVRKRAEIAERERARADRRRMNQQERERDRAARVLGPRTGGRSGGLTVGGLEDDDDLGGGGGGGSGSTRRRTKAPRKPRRRNSEYSEDEDERYGRRGGKEDEYDKDDGFLVGSDEDIEVGEDDSEEDEFGDGDGDVDADGEEDDGTGPAAAAAAAADKKDGKDGKDAAKGARRRRVIDDDDEDDE